MLSADAPLRPVRVIVVANEKGGSGKSTVAMHIAVALMKRGLGVATIDLDSRQKTFTHYIENRRSWAARVSRDLATPEHLCLDNAWAVQDETAASKALTDTIDVLSHSHDFVVIDTPGHDSPLMRLAHSMADILITPLVVFREFYLRGLTALDDFDEATLGKRPTMSHATARQEVEILLQA